METNPPLTSKMIFLASVLFIAISFIVLYFWKGDNTIDFISSLFSLEHIVQDVVFGISCGLFLLICLTVLILLKKADLPNTKGSNDMKNIVKQSNSAIFSISTFTVIGEELFFRGVLLLLFTTFMPVWLAIVITSVIFIGLHYKGQYEGQPYIITYLFVMSLLTGIVTTIQYTLWAALIIHCICNVASCVVIRKEIIR